ncbi:hypothetical protein RT42_GL001616 [Enterococcus cecorum DSM 20682 = ATCC 43198]|nr:hypothetical protein RT42_GL001616 [Enterococcus cecorum DSM 20682 = ATCC 43198]
MSNTSQILLQKFKEKEIFAMFLNKADHLKTRMIDKPSLTYPPFSLKK